MRTVITILLVLFCKGRASCDTVYVASSSFTATIQKFDSNGNGSIFASGLNDPRGLAFDSEGNLYAAEHGNGGIWKFDSAGHNLGVFASVGGLNGPTALAFDGTGNLYVSFVTEMGSGGIEKFDPYGNGSAFASFAWAPGGIAIDNSGNVFVSNFGHFVGPYADGFIEKFDANGDGIVFVPNLNGPEALAFDSAGHLFASVINDGAVMRFDSNGNGSLFASGITDSPGSLAFGAEDLYMSHSSGIAKFDMNGNESVFVSGVEGAIAVQVPEPGSLSFLVLLAAVHRGLVLGHKKDRR